MSKPPPNDWQAPPQAERVALGTMHYGVAAGNPQFLSQQQPNQYNWLQLQHPAVGYYLPSCHYMQYHPLMPQPQSDVLCATVGNGDNAVHVNDSDSHGDDNDINMDETTTATVAVAVGGTGGEHVNDDESSSSVGRDDDGMEMLRVGQVFADVAAFDTAVTTYCTLHNYDVNRKRSNNRRAHGESVEYIRYHCVRGRKFKSASKGGPDARKRTSLKVDCGFKICGRQATPADILKSNGDLTSASIKIISLELNHTNGCKGADELVRAKNNQLRGRKYSNVALTYLRNECKSGRYTISDVQGWLTEQGMTDVTLKEATNLRYRLMNDKPVKGYDYPSKEKDGQMTDYLINRDLESEVSDGGQKSIDALDCVHKGSSSQIRGYNYRMTTDSEKRRVSRKEIDKRAIANAKPTSLKTTKVLKSVANTYKGILFSEDFSDVTFECSDGVSVPAHKIILAASSPYFKTAFQGNWAENNVDGIWRTSHSSSLIKSVLTLIYTGSVEECQSLLAENESDPLGLLNLACEYDIKPLVLISVDNCIKHIKFDNVRTMLQSAHVHSCKELKKSCFEYIKANATKALMSPDMMCLATEDPELWAELGMFLNGKRPRSDE